MRTASARVIIVDDGKVLLIHRVKPTDEYYVVPGGGVEAGETIEQGAMREAMEELGLSVSIEPFYVITHPDTGEICHYFKAKTFKGKVRLGGPEAKTNNMSNQYHLEWIPFEKLAGLNIVPKETKEKLMELAKES